MTRRDPFICPYCHQTVQVENDEDWIYHVYSDLRPYICTFGGCVKENQLYDSFTEWSAHERQFHRREWFCTLCSYTGEKSSFIRHLDDPQRDIPNEQRQEMEDQSKSSTLAQQCPLCTKPPISNPGRFQQCLARHLQQLSLVVLPRGEADDEEDSAAREEESNESRHALVMDDEDIESIFSFSASLAESSISGLRSPIDGRLMDAIPQETINNTPDDVASESEYSGILSVSRPPDYPYPTLVFPYPINREIMNDTSEDVGDELEGTSTVDSNQSTPDTFLRREANDQVSVAGEVESNESQKALVVDVENRESIHSISIDDEASMTESSFSGFEFPTDDRLSDTIPQDTTPDTSEDEDSISITGAHFTMPNLDGPDLNLDLPKDRKWTASDYPDIVASMAESSTSGHKHPIDDRLVDVMPQEPLLYPPEYIGKDLEGVSMVNPIERSPDTLPKTAVDATDLLEHSRNTFGPEDPNTMTYMEHITEIFCNRGDSLSWRRF